MKRKSVMVGTAGWSIPRALADEFVGEGSHLQRYAQRMPCAEINSSFYRDHSFSTYHTWAAATPASFRFSVKLPQLITHELQLRRARVPLQRFLAQARGLGKKLGPLLVQLPPSLEFNVRASRSFFRMLREEHDGPVVCEPRHAGWFEPKAEAVLIEHRVGRVATDPTRIDVARQPGGWIRSQSGNPDAIAYYRLHGSPRKYWSRYELHRIQKWANEISNRPPGSRVWCIFDNTASGAALANALQMIAIVRA